MSLSSFNLLDAKEKSAQRIHFYVIHQGPTDTSLQSLTVQFTTFTNDSNGTAYEKTRLLLDKTIIGAMRRNMEALGIQDEASAVPQELKRFFVINRHTGRIRPAPHIRSTLYYLNTLKKELMRRHLISANIMFDYRCADTPSPTLVEENFTEEDYVNLV